MTRAHQPGNTVAPSRVYPRMTTDSRVFAASPALSGYRSEVITSSSRVTSVPLVAVSAEPIVLRRVIGEQLRGLRQAQGRTLREVSSSARVSLGYLSEVERGQKEASSELLAAICGALEVPLSLLLRLVSDDVARTEMLQTPAAPVVVAA